MSKVSIMSQILGVLSKREDVSFALRNAANSYGINIEQLKELLKDVDEKTSKFADSESSETGVPDSTEDWFQYPEAYS